MLRPDVISGMGGNAIDVFHGTSQLRDGADLYVMPLNGG